MADVTPLLRPTQKIIQSYTQGRFKISGDVFEGGVIVGADFVQSWDASADLADVSQFKFLKGSCDVLLIGTGKSASPLTPAMRQIFRAEGLNAELMDTGAACRTFNVLTAEGRQVVAALIPV
jgi:uncharacterized protein